MQKKFSPKQGELLPVRSVNSAKALAQLKRLKPDLHVVAGFPQIFKKQLLQIPKLGTINLHAGRLPAYRGGSPLNWQMINGEKKIGISAVLMDEGIDSGRILATAEFKLKEGDTIAEAHEKANHLFPRILLKSIRLVLLKGKQAGRPQKSASATYWHQRQDEDGEIEFKRMTSQEVIRKVRALTHPYPGAWALLNGKKVRIYAAKMPLSSHRGTPGRAFYTKNGQIYVGCRDFAVCLEKIKPIQGMPGAFYFDR
jgi:methionyl-tRNA formyltransferase